MTPYEILAAAKKFRTYKLSGTYYGHCPHCSEVKIHKQYDHLVDLLEMHARDDHPEVLDKPHS